MNMRGDLGRFARPRVLLLGTGTHLPEFESRLPGVPAVATTVADFRQTLIERCGLGEEFIQTALDTSTVEELGDIIADVCISAEDFLMIYYVGHGTVDSTGQLYLATTRTSAREGRVEHTALPYSILGRRVRDSPARYRVVILDCCFSARAFEGASGLGEPNQLAGQTEITGGFVLTSASRLQMALSPAGARQTLFTGALIKMLRDGSPGGPPHLTLSELWRGSIRVMDGISSSRPIPMPRCRADGDVGSLIIASNPAYRPPPLLLPHQVTLESGQTATSVCPYVGLAAFDVNDSRWFYGRDKVTKWLLEELAECYRSAGRPVVVIGASGAGKSSVLRAGLIAALSDDDLGIAGSSAWPVRVFTPTNDPLRSLAIQISSLVGESVNRVVEDLRRDPHCITQKLRRALIGNLNAEATDAARVLLIVDQFEEIFTLGGTSQHPSNHGNDLAAFLQALEAAMGVGSAGGPALVVLCMRADDYGRCAEHVSLASVLQHTPIVVIAMTASEILDAIQRPAQDAGLTFEPGLVDLIIDDLGAANSLDLTGHRVAYEAGRLPLLSHALRTTWQNKVGNQLTYAGYRQTGGIAKALSTTADSVLSQISAAYGDHGAAVAEQILVRLIHVTSNSEPARLRVTRTDLLAGLPRPLTFQVLNTLAGDHARIISTGTQVNALGRGDNTIELTHDALLRQWPTLQRLIDENRQALTIDGDLRIAAERWIASGRDAHLYQDDDLVAARRVFSDPERSRNLTPNSVQFLEASIAYDRRRRSRRTGGVVALWCALLVTTLSSGIAVWQAQIAGTAAAQALSRQLANEADQQFNENPDLASVLAVEAVRRAKTEEALRSLSTAAARPLRHTFTGFRGNVLSVAFSPDGAVLATADTTGEIRLWTRTTGALLRAIPPPQGAPNLGYSPILAFSPDGSEIAAGGSDGNVNIWSVESGQVGLALSGHTNWITAITFSSDGNIIVTASADDTARVWSAQSGAAIAKLAGHIDNLSAVALSPDNNRVATASFDGTIRLWETGSYTNVATLADHEGAVYDVTFSPSGDQLASVGEDRIVRLWESQSGSLVSKLGTHSDKVLLVRFSRDGTRLATASYDHTARLWNVSARTLTATLVAGEGPVWGLAFSPDSARLVTAGDDGVVRTWNARSGLPLASLSGHDGPVQAVSFSPDGSQVASAGNDRTARLWDAYSGDPATVKLDVSSPSIAMQYSPDGEAIGTAGTDGSVSTWNTKTATLMSKFETHMPASQADFSGDLERLATVNGRSVHVWDTRTGASIGTFNSGGGSLYAISISADGVHIAAAGADDFVYVWNTVSRTLVSISANRPKPDPDLVGSISLLAFSPDGSSVIGVGDGRRIRLWDARTGVLKQKFPDQSTPIRGVAFDPERPKVAVIGDATDAKLLDLNTGTETTITHGSSKLGAAAFSPDGRYLALAGGGGVRFWGLRENSLAAESTIASGAVSTVSFSPDSAQIAVAYNDVRPVELQYIQQFQQTSTVATTQAVCFAVNRDLTRVEWHRFIPGEPYEKTCSSR